MTHPIPTAALDDRLGIVGTSGSGKTYGAGTAVERILARKSRVIIPDPLGVWYGLRLAADGRTASGFDVVIFGGPHGDLAINEHAGPQLAIFDHLVKAMAEISRADLAYAIGWEPSGSNLRNRLSELSSLEIVEYPSRGGVRLQDWVTE